MENVDGPAYELWVRDEHIKALKEEVEAVLQIMDDHASVWGDEGVFRRCRDRLRKLVSEPIEAVADVELPQE